MSINAELVGNVLQTPTMKAVTIKGEDRMIAHLRVMSSVYRRENDGSRSQVDEKTFPVDVTIWHEATAERVVKLIKTGASVSVQGQLFVAPWKDDAGALHAGVRMDADSVSLNLHRVEQVVFRARQPRNADDAGNSQSRSTDEFPTDMDAPART